MTFEILLQTIVRNEQFGSSVLKMCFLSHLYISEFMDRTELNRAQPFKTSTCPAYLIVEAPRLFLTFLIKILKTIW